MLPTTQVLEVPSAPFSSNDRGLMALRWRLGVSMEGPEFFVASGNIMTARVDAIVTSAASTLTRGEGVIVKTGGGRFISVCRRWFRRYTRLRAGQAMATRADKLPCTYVIHVRGPPGQCTQRAGVEAEQLRTVICNALREADRLQLTSIAMPGISCDGCDYSKELAAKEIVDACVLYAQQHGNATTLKSILFLDSDVATHRGFVNALRGRAASIDRDKMPTRVYELPFIDEIESLSTLVGELHLTSPTRTVLEHLGSDDPDYWQVAAGLPHDLARRVVSIRRVRISAHHREYEKLKERLVNVHELDDLFHGTPDRWRATAIALNGFDLSIRLCGRSYGDGVYTSTDVNAAFCYAKGKGSLVKLRGLVMSSTCTEVSHNTIILDDMHVFPNPTALLPLLIIDFAAGDEKDRAAMQQL